LIKEAEAESANSNKMEGMRRHTEKMSLANAYDNNKSNLKMVVAGKNGQDILDYYINSIQLVETR
jgi:hypothetical protein